MQKTYVLDTNVLLHDPMAIHAFHEHKVVIPMTVLEELDSIKDRKQKDVSKEARIAINAIEKIVQDASPEAIQQGVNIRDAHDGRLAIFDDQQLGQTLPTVHGSPQQANDNIIINVALQLQTKHAPAFVALVTKDINMRIKAKSSGLLHVEDYRRDKVLDDIDLLSKGHLAITGSFWDKVSQVDTEQQHNQTVHLVARDVIEEPYPGLFIQDDEGFFGYIETITEQQLHIVDLNYDSLMHQRCWGLRPRNIDQAMAMHLLGHPSIDLSILTGPAGSGKTLLALASALEAIIEKQQYDKLIIARSTPPMAEDIGFLPGTEEEKMAPWLAAFEDNLEVLHGRDESPFSSIDYVKEKANIQFKSLNFMRGRSFNNSFIIIDEAQSLSQFQLKSIITRVGKNSKIVILGNLAQIDNFYINPLTSGLTYLVEKMKHFEHAGIMHIAGIERSRLAAFAEENL